MAQIKCPKCENLVDPGIAECPKCGLVFKKYQERVQRTQKESHAQLEERRKRLTRCPACDSTISKRASSCPGCGEPQNTQTSKNRQESAGELMGIVDFQFTKFITPQLVKIIYILVFILGLLGTIGVIIASLRSFSIMQIITAVIAYMIIILIARVSCESALLLFRIEENTRR